MTWWGGEYCFIAGSQHIIPLAQALFNKRVHDTCILKCVDINAFVEQGAAHIYCECEEEEEGTGVRVAIIGLSDGRFKQWSMMMKNSTTQKYFP